MSSFFPRKSSMFPQLPAKALVPITAAHIANAVRLDNATSTPITIADAGDGGTINVTGAAPGTYGYTYDFTNLTDAVDENGDVVLYVGQSTSALSIVVGVWDGSETAPGTLYRPTATGLLGLYNMSEAAGVFSLTAVRVASATTSTVNYSRHVLQSAPDGVASRVARVEALTLADGAIPPDGSSLPAASPVWAANYRVVGDRLTAAARSPAAVLRPWVCILRDGVGTSPLNMWYQPPAARGLGVHAT